MRRRRLQLLFAEGTIKRSLLPSFWDIGMSAGMKVKVLWSRGAFLPLSPSPRNAQTPCTNYLTSARIIIFVVFHRRLIRLSSLCKRICARDPERILMYTRRAKIVKQNCCAKFFFYFSHTLINYRILIANNTHTCLLLLFLFFTSLYKRIDDCLSGSYLYLTPVRYRLW